MAALTGKSNLLLYGCYRVVSRLYFHLPILLPYLYGAGLGLVNVTLLLAVYGLVGTFAGGATDLLLRRLRQKQVVICGELLKLAGLLLVIYGTLPGRVSLGVVLVGQILGGVGFSTALSTDTSLLRSLVESLGCPELFGTVQARTQSYMFIATLVAGSVGGLLFAHQPAWPLLASCAAAAASVLVLLAMDDPRGEPETQTPAAEGDKTPLMLAPDQRFWVRFYALSRAFTLAPFIGFIPFFFVKLQVAPYMLGIVLSVFSLAAFAAARCSDTMIRRYGESVHMALTVTSMVGATLIFGRGDWLASHGIDYFVAGLAGIALLGLGSGGVRPTTMSHLELRGMTPQQRTRLFARMERDFGLLNAAILVGGGYVIVFNGFQSMMSGLALTYLAVVGALLLGRAAQSRPYRAQAMRDCGDSLSDGQ